MSNTDLCDFHTNTAKFVVNSQINNKELCAFLGQDSFDKHVHNSTMSRTKTNSIIADWLTKSLTKAGMTQSQLAREVGLTSQKINRTIHGSREMTAEEIIRISHVLRAPIPSLPGSTPLHNTSSPVAPGSVSTEINDADFDKVLDAVLRAAKKVEQDDYDGNMPIKDYVAAVTIGLKSHRK